MKPTCFLFICHMSLTCFTASAADNRFYMYCIRNETKLDSVCYQDRWIFADSRDPKIETASEGKELWRWTRMKDSERRSLIIIEPTVDIHFNADSTGEEEIMDTVTITARAVTEHEDCEDGPVYAFVYSGTSERYLKLVRR